jgi:hypothetical protein
MKVYFNLINTSIINEKFVLIKNAVVAYCKTCQYNYDGCCGITNCEEVCDLVMQDCAFISIFIKQIFKENKSKY